LPVTADASPALPFAILRTIDYAGGFSDLKTAIEEQGWTNSAPPPVHEPVLNTLGERRDPPTGLPEHLGGEPRLPGASGILGDYMGGNIGKLHRDPEFHADQFRRRSTRCYRGSAPWNTS
jgi:hypothetical protein